MYNTDSKSLNGNTEKQAESFFLGKNQSKCKGT